MATATSMPVKTREIQTCICDSTRWKWFTYRDDDIVVATYGKTGTTWTQQIVSQLVLGPEESDLFNDSPWLDLRVIPLELVLGGLEAQAHRRFLKTHLPLDALLFSPKAKYIYIARDGRDTAWSLHNHHAGFTPQTYDWFNSIPGRVGPPMAPPPADVVQYFREWLDGGGLQLGATFFEHVQGWWDARHLPNVLLVHFNQLKADLPRQMRRIAAFLGIAINEERFPTMVEHCTFEYMRNFAKAPILDQIFQKGGATFFNKGTNGRWRDLLTAADLEEYARVERERLTPDCARWVATGEMA